MAPREITTEIPQKCTDCFDIFWNAVDCSFIIRYGICSYCYKGTPLL